MSKKRRQRSSELKAQVGLEALKGVEPVHVIAARHKIHPVQVSLWKKEVAARLPELFARKTDGDMEAMKAQEKEFFGKTKGDTSQLLTRSIVH